MVDPARRDSIAFRPGAVEDVESLFDVRCAVREDHQSREELAGLGITPDTVAAMIAGDDCITTVATHHGRIVGLTMAQISKAYIFACFVHPDFEGRGIGRALMTAAEDGLRRAGVRDAWLTTGTEPGLRAVGFYEHLGWRQDGVVDGDLRFVKRLEG